MSHLKVETGEKELSLESETDAPRDSQLKLISRVSSSKALYYNLKGITDATSPL